MIVIGIGTTASQAASKRKRQHLSQPTGVIKSLVRHYPGTARQSEGISEGIYDEHTGFSFYISMLWTIFGSPYLRSPAAPPYLLQFLRFVDTLCDKASIALTKCCDILFLYAVHPVTHRPK